MRGTAGRSRGAGAQPRAADSATGLARHAAQVHVPAAGEGAESGHEGNAPAPRPGLSTRPRRVPARGQRRRVHPNPPVQSRKHSSRTHCDHVDARAVETRRPARPDPTHPHARSRAAAPILNVPDVPAVAVRRVRAPPHPSPATPGGCRTRGRVTPEPWVSLDRCGSDVVSRDADHRPALQRFVRSRPAMITGITSGSRAFHARAAGTAPQRARPGPNRSRARRGPNSPGAPG